MNEQEYKRLTQICDKLLLDRPDDIYRIAIGWLHVLKENTYLLAHYKVSCAELFPKFFYYLAHRFISLCKSALFHIFALDLRKIDKGKDLLILSHLINIQHYDSEKDFYFGKINVDLDAQFLLQNHIGRSARKIKASHKSSHKSSQGRIILPTTMNPFVELFILVKGFQQSILLFIMGLACREAFEKSIIFRAAIESLSPTTLAALRIRHQIGVIIKQNQPKAILTTYEGHAWERLVYQLAKQHHPTILRLGYHHPAITRLEHASKRALSAEFNPDYILTTGEVGYHQFKKGLKMQNCNIAILGSFKKTKNIQKTQTAKNTQKTCLILPEIFPDECISLLAYTLDCAALHRDIMFLFRFHPMVSEREICNLIGSRKLLPSNVKISSAPIEEDIARAKWAIYKGSTSIIQACLAGVIPVYHNIPGQLHVDVFHEISAKVPTVSNCKDFSHIVQKEYDVSDIVDYCKRFYSEMDYSVVQKII